MCVSVAATSGRAGLPAKMPLFAFHLRWSIVPSDAAPRPRVAHLSLHENGTRELGIVLDQTRGQPVAYVDASFEVQADFKSQTSVFSSLVQSLDPGPVFVSSCWQQIILKTQQRQSWAYHHKSRPRFCAQGGRDQVTTSPNHFFSTLSSFHNQ